MKLLPRLAAIGAVILLSIGMSAPAQAIAVVRDTEIEDYLWDVSRPVFKAAGIDPEAVTIYFVSDNSVNAFVAEGQNMFIFSGLIERLKRPNQLLGVIAHETGHIAGGHLARASGAMQAEAAPFLIAMLGGIAAMVAGAGDAGMGIILGAQQAMQRALLGYSRVQEASADQAAVTFLDKIGKSSRGMYEVFEGFSQQEMMSSASQDPFVRSHPLSRERMASLLERIEASPHKEVPDSAEDIRRYELIVAKIRGYLIDPNETFTLYPVSDMSQPALYARSIAFMRVGRFADALAHIEAALQNDPRNAYFYEVKGQILFDQGQRRAAVDAFQKSSDLRPGAPLLLVNLGTTLVQLGDASLLPRGRDALREALRRDPSNAFAWLQLSIAYDGLGDEGQAALCLAEQNFNLGNYAGAIRFANRAKEKLKAGSRERERAEDIIAIATANAPDDERGGRGRLSLKAAAGADYSGSPFQRTTP